MKHIIVRYFGIEALARWFLFLELFKDHLEQT